MWHLRWSAETISAVFCPVQMWIIHQSSVINGEQRAADSWLRLKSFFPYSVSVNTKRCSKSKQCPRGPSTPAAESTSVCRPLCERRKSGARDKWRANWRAGTSVINHPRGNAQSWAPRYSYRCRHNPYLARGNAKTAFLLLLVIPVYFKGKLISSLESKLIVIHHFEKWVSVKTPLHTQVNTQTLLIMMKDVMFMIQGHIHMPLPDFSKLGWVGDVKLNTDNKDFYKIV